MPAAAAARRVVSAAKCAEFIHARRTHARAAPRASLISIKPTKSTSASCLSLHARARTRTSQVKGELGKL